MRLPHVQTDADRDGHAIRIDPDVTVGIMTTPHAGWQDTSGASPAGDEVKITERPTTWCLRSVAAVASRKDQVKQGLWGELDTRRRVVADQ